MLTVKIRGHQRQSTVSAKCRQMSSADSRSGGVPKHGVPDAPQDLRFFPPQTRRRMTAELPVPRDLHVRPLQTTSTVNHRSPNPGECCGARRLRFSRPLPVRVLPEMRNAARQRDFRFPRDPPHAEAYCAARFVLYFLPR